MVISKEVAREEKKIVTLHVPAKSATKWQDSFYLKLSDEKLRHVHEHNFYHPDAFDTDLLVSCMERLKLGEAVDIPNYDFKSHTKEPDARIKAPEVFSFSLALLTAAEMFPWVVNPSDVIILEGILVLHESRVRNLMNMKIFVDTDSDLHLARRIQRDTVERGRDIQAVLLQPGFEDFILPSKKYADIVVPRGAANNIAIDLIAQHIRTKLVTSFNLFQIREMHTRIRDIHTANHEFIFYADRLIRLVVEHGLGHLPFSEKKISTSTGLIYSGVTFCRKLCGVSIIRSGESMENALRACCKGIKIGKILFHGEQNNNRQLIYEKLPADISDRRVLLLDPVLATGNSAVKAISLLISTGVKESNVIFLNLISSPEGIQKVCERYPSVTLVTSEIDTMLDKKSRVIPVVFSVLVNWLHVLILA
ncbi:hypothetical protein Sjap_016283 [Stephania japonica]|uniref:Uridine/cytidine kinase n=1 Tax=Stephania japonica TaxID=461633 RepID=A0AAP0IKR4_9MAGN